MADKISKERRSENMRRIRSKNMKPEMVIRKLVHNMGYRYRLHRKDLPGKPDLVFSSRRKAIFIHGCFWHQHSDPTCPICRQPKSNSNYWEPKLKRNVQRDKESQNKLHEMGWKTLTIWECDLKKKNVSKKISRFLEN